MLNSLTRLRVTNFQAHESLDLKLDPVTVLVGDSDVGKSSVLRAIRWLVTNKPNGTEFIREGTEETEVRVKVDNQTVVRTRGKDNTYQLGQQEFKAFGQGVPETIQQVLNLDGELNFQDQHDAVFWFSQSPGEVAKRLNAIVNLEGIDRVMGEAQSRARKAKQTCEILEEQEAKATKTLEELQYTKALQRDWQECTLQKLTLVDLTCDSTALKSFLEQVDKLVEIVDRGDKLAIEEFPVIERKHNCVNELIGQQRQLSRLIQDVLTQQTDREILLQDLQQAEQELKTASRDYRCPTCGQRIKNP